jgi:methylated-DNA-[protein]-cysteine S-methyltransferase
VRKIQISEFKSPYGDLILGSYEFMLCLCDWKWRKMRYSIDSRLRNGLDAEFVESEDEIIKMTKIQLNEYFAKQREVFDIPLLFVGSDFQKKVWEELLMVPYGETETYSGLSARIGKPDAVRAVASANGANAISIIVPCHRIIGSNGDLTGYAGGIRVKKKLLELEHGGVIALF